MRAEVLHQSQLAERGLRLPPPRLGRALAGGYLEGHLQLQPRGGSEPRQLLRGEVHPLLRRHGPVPGDPLATPPSQVTSHPISVFNARWPRTANSWRRGTMAMSLVSPNNCWQTSITRSALPAWSNDPT